ncbi:hypothetical protein [Vibrio splendidus]|uniref:hypothetical protein n=1 Tax=Vibrio splendidus TaxID=29497 RepID=UPI003D10DA56
MDIKILQALFLFAYCHKCNTENAAFENTDAGIELENIAFNLIEQTSFPIDNYEAALARGNVFDRTKLMVEEIKKQSDCPKLGASPLYIALNESPLFEDPAFLVEKELNEITLKPWLCSHDEVLDLTNQAIVNVNSLNELNLLEGLWNFGSSQIMLIKIG